MRLLGATAMLLAVVASGCASEDGSAAELSTQLRITVWPRGREAGGARQWTLRCNPPGGTLPNRSRACTRLASLSAPFKPVPRDAICTMIYGGPQEARVTGTFRGRRVDAHFQRTNGCEIARWERVALLFPVAVGADA